jgi:nucleotide-binding universal stress UspA family protein
MNVLWAVDASTPSAAAVPAVAAQWPPRDTVVRLLAVVEPVAPPAAALWYDAGGSLERVLELREEQAGDVIRSLAARLGACGFAVDEAVRRGSPRRVISSEARAWPADLVVLTVSKRSGLARWAVGGTALWLARRASCAVEILEVESSGDAAADSAHRRAVELPPWTRRVGE